MFRINEDIFRCPKCNSQVFFMGIENRENTFWCVGCGLDGTHKDMIKIAAGVKERMNRDSHKKRERPFTNSE